MYANLNIINQVPWQQMQFSSFKNLVFAFLGYSVSRACLTSALHAFLLFFFLSFLFWFRFRFSLFGVCLRRPVERKHKFRTLNLELKVVSKRLCVSRSLDRVHGRVQQAKRGEVESLTPSRVNVLARLNVLTTKMRLCRLRECECQSECV